MSQFTSRCDDSKRNRKEIIRNMFLDFFHNKLCNFEGAIKLKLDHIYKLTVVSCMFNILESEKYPTYKSSLYMSYPRHSYNKRNIHDMLLPKSGVELHR